MFAKLPLHRARERPYPERTDPRHGPVTPSAHFQGRVVFSVVAHYGTKPGATDEVLAPLTGLAEATRKEPGNISYDFYRGVQDPAQVVILESYHDAEDFDQHRESQHFVELAPGKSFPGSLPAPSLPTPLRQAPMNFHERLRRIYAMVLSAYCDDLHSPCR